MLQNIQKDQSTAALRRLFFNVELSAQRNEIHRIDLGDASTGDTFTLTYNGNTTTAISWNATPATTATNIKSAVDALSGLGTVTVAQVSGNIFSITLDGTDAGTTVNLPTIGSPTTFTPGAVTRYVTGGLINSPALGETFSASELKLSKNGASFANNAGSVTEVGEGVYYYAATTGEVDTEGSLLMSINKTGLAAAQFLFQITPVSAVVNGETVLATGTLQSATADSVTLASGETSNSNYFIPCRLDITAGPGSGQGGKLGFAYNGTTKVLQVEPPFIVLPDNTSTYKLTSIAPMAFDTYRANHQTANTFGGDAATPEDIVDAVVARGDELAAAHLDLVDGVETSITPRQLMRILGAALAGRVSGAGTGTETFRNLGNTKDRIVATNDTAGNRLTITLDLS